MLAWYAPDFALISLLWSSDIIRQIHLLLLSVSQIDICQLTYLWMYSLFKTMHAVWVGNQWKHVATAEIIFKYLQNILFYFMFVFLLYCLHVFFLV